MKLAISNIALPSFKHERELSALVEMGFTGLEVAPSKVWQDTMAVTGKKMKRYRSMAEAAGLAIVGLHSLFFDQPDLALFRDVRTTSAMLDFMEHLSTMCATLGGRTLVFGSGSARKRGNLPTEAADEQTIEFFTLLAERIEGHGTCVVIEALSSEFSDYIATLEHAQRIIDVVNRPELQSHIDLAAASAARDIGLEQFQGASATLAHVHVNEPGLGPLGMSQAVDHALAAQSLRQAGYSGYCSLEQRMDTNGDIFGPIRQSMQVLKEFYV